MLVADVLIFSFAAGLIAWAITMVKGVVVPLHGYLNQPDVRPIVVAAVAVAFLVAILTPAVMLITDTAKRLLYARRHVLLVTVYENGDLNDDFGGKPWLTI